MPEKDEAVHIWLLALGCGPQGHPDKEDTLLAQLLRAALYPLVAPNTHSRDFSG